MKLSVLLALLVPAVFAGAVSAELYRYVDNKGELHFVDDISKVPKKYRNQMETEDTTSAVSVMDATPSQPRRAAADPSPPPATTSYGSKNVEVFVTSWCGYCKKMVRFLKEKGIPYTAYDIERDSDASRIYRSLGGGGVPIVRIGTEVIHGYDPEGVMAVLNR